jgi:hypothetical protein
LCISYFLVSVSHTAMTRTECDRYMWCAQRLCINTSKSRKETSLLYISVRSPFRRNFESNGRKMSLRKENKRSLFPFGGTWCRYIPGDRASRNSYIRPRVNSGGFRVDTWQSTMRKYQDGLCSSIEGQHLLLVCVFCIYLFIYFCQHKVGFCYCLFLVI